MYFLDAISLLHRGDIHGGMHNQVLRELVEVIEKQRKDAKHTGNKSIDIQFVKEGGP